MTPTSNMNKNSILSYHFKETTKPDTTQPDSKQQFKIEFPMNIFDFNQHMIKYLYPVEKKEILNYQEIYFFNWLERKIQNNLDGPSGPYNDGFDNAQGEYKYEKRDHIAYRFEIVSKLGKGSFGQVVKCFDHKEKKFIALKIIMNKKKLLKQGIVEVQMLEHLRDHDKDDKHNIIKIKEHFYFRSHLCIVFEVLSKNLYEHIKETDF